MNGELGGFPPPSSLPRASQGDAHCSHVNPGGASPAPAPLRFPEALACILSHGFPSGFGVWQPVNEMLTISGFHRPSGATKNRGRMDGLPGTAPAYSGNFAQEIARAGLGVPTGEGR